MGETPRRQRGPRAARAAGKGGPRRSGRRSRVQPAGGRAAPSPEPPLGRPSRLRSLGPAGLCEGHPGLDRRKEKGIVPGRLQRGFGRGHSSPLAPGLSAPAAGKAEAGGRGGARGRARTGKIRRGCAEARVDPSLDRLWLSRSRCTETNACPSCQETAAFKPAATSSSSLFPSPALARPSPGAPPPPAAAPGALPSQAGRWGAGRALDLAQGIGPRRAGGGVPPRVRTADWLVGVEEAGTGMTEV